jgi:hypothetical protein
MSPEQVRGGEVGAAADIYALGVIAFEMLAGRLPLPVHELPLADALRAISDEEPPSLRSVRNDVDADLATIVAVAMSKEADQRYPSAAAFAADLRRCLRQQPIHARPPTTRYRIQKFVRRHRRLVLATASAFVMLLAATIVTSVLAMQNAVLAADEHTARIGLGERSAELRQQNYCLEMNGLLATMRSPSARPRIEAALQRWRPTTGERDLRGFEWFLLSSLHKDAAPELPTPGQTYNVHWHPTRPWLLVSGNGFAHVVDVTDRRRVADLGFGQHMYVVRWSPDGTMVAGNGGRGLLVKAVDPDGTVRPVFEFGEPDLQQRAVAWHRDNQRLAALTYKGPAWIVDRTGQRPTLRIEDAGGGNAPEFQPNGDLLAIGAGLAHADDFTIRHRYSLPDHAHAMAWSHAGSRVAVALRGRPAQFDATGTLRRLHDQPADVLAFAWSPDDRSLAMISGNGMVEVRDAATWTRTQRAPWRRWSSARLEPGWPLARDRAAHELCRAARLHRTAAGPPRASATGTTAVPWRSAVASGRSSAGGVAPHCDAGRRRRDRRGRAFRRQHLVAALVPRRLAAGALAEPRGRRDERRRHRTARDVCERPRHAKGGGSTRVARRQRRVADQLPGTAVVVDNRATAAGPDLAPLRHRSDGLRAHRRCRVRGRRGQPVPARHHARSGAARVPGAEHPGRAVEP